MTNEERARLIDAAIAMRSAGYTLQEIAETLHIEGVVVKAIDSKLEIVDF